MLAGYVMSGGRSMLFLQATSTDWAEMFDNVCGPIVFPHNFGFVATKLALLLSFGCRLNLVLGYLKVLKDLDGWGVIGASDVKLTSFPLQTYVEILRYTRQESKNVCVVAAITPWNFPLAMITMRIHYER
ncbi:phospholipase-like protein [Tanacetum coccineum]